MNTSRIWIFDEQRLEVALTAYQEASIKVYPQQEKRIRTTVAAMRDFLYSEQADRLVMGKTKEKPR